MLVTHTKKIIAAKIGGKRRIELYGNPGTKEGRAKGGRNSLLTQKIQKSSNFKTLTITPFPKKDEELAEIVGIFFGDGHLSYYQSSITLNSEKDEVYAHFVTELLEKKLKIQTRKRLRRTAKAIDIVISSRMITEHLSKLGIPVGNKLKKGLVIPFWILAKKKLLSAFLRGLFDTDGSIYLEKKIVKQKTYHYPCISISSASDDFLKEVKNSLLLLAIHSTSTSKNKILIRTHTGVISFMKLIGTHNMKHLTKYHNILQLKLGNVA